MVLAAFLLPLAFSPALYHSFWAPKAAVCLLLVGPGLVALAALVRDRRPAAVLAALFLVAAAISTLVSGNVVAALTGAPNWGTGLVFLAVLVGAWALGVTAGSRRRRQIVLALLAAALVNAVVAWLQAWGLDLPSLESPGRSAGLMGNPVQLGAFIAGAVWLVCDKVGRRRQSPLWLGALVLLAGAAQLSGGRAAVGLTLLAILASLRRAGWRRGATLVVAVALGFAAAPTWATGDAVTGSSRAIGPESTKQVDTRVGYWRAGAQAVVDRPLLGWGPGRFQAATSERSTAAMTEGGVSVFADAHNWVVEYAVTTGLVGLALLGAWLVAAGRASGGPLVGFAAIVGLSMLVEPQSAGVTPLALLALGAATRGPPPERPAGWGWRLASAVGLFIGVAAAATFLAGEAFLGDARLDTSPPSFEQGAALLPPWADVSRLGARIESFHGLHSPPHQRRALALARQATRRDPADPQAWAFLGQLELVWGTDDGAAQALRRARQRNPWLAEALASSAVLAQRTGDDEARAGHCGRLKVLGKVPPVCRGPATVDP